MEAFQISSLPESWASKVKTSKRISAGNTPSTQVLFKSSTTWHRGRTSGTNRTKSVEISEKASTVMMSSGLLEMCTKSTRRMRTAFKLQSTLRRNRTRHSKMATQGSNSYSTIAKEYSNIKTVMFQSNSPKNLRVRDLLIT